MHARWSNAHYAALFFLLILLLPLAVAHEQIGLLATWWAIMLLFTAFVLVLGHGITGMWRGVFIDDRNVISLSRFQMLAWTVLILSAFMAAAFWNIFGTDLASPLTPISLPSTLWLLMGISTTSLVASPLILGTKKQQQPDAGEMQRTFSLLDQAGYADSTNHGLIVANRDIGQAAWTDMFTGEETSNAAHVDLSRVQMFFFTLVALLAYGSLLGHLFAAPASSGVGAFPALPDGLLGLIGISHAGYLTLKAMPVSRTGDGSSNPPLAPASADEPEQPAVG